MIIVLAVLALLAVLVAVRMRAGVPVRRPEPPRRPETLEGRLWRLFRRLPASDKVTVVVLVLAGLLAVTLGLYALALRFS